ncbi:MAG: hypothetical protein IPM82_12015 [Saprospiraceae bacterium]|nr:hypothetical protein [Saprospiraceae bacterium]
MKKIIKVVLIEAEKITLLVLESGNPPSYSLNIRAVMNANLLYSPKAIHQSWITSLLSNTLNNADIDSSIKVNKYLKDDVRNSIKAELSKSPTENTLHVFRKRAAVFGHNAPKQVIYTTRRPYVPEPPAKWEELDLAKDEENNKIFLDNAYEQILKGSFIFIQKTSAFNPDDVFEVSSIDTHPRNAYGISAKSTVITTKDKGWWNKNNKNLGTLRRYVVHAQSEELSLAEIPIETPVSGLTVELSSLYQDLKKGKPVVISGERSDLAGVFVSEIKSLENVKTVSGRTVLTFNTKLEYSYIRKSVTINANIAEATHGETVREVLGSGNATQTFQKFVLKQPPLTFVSAATPSGGQSTLEIRVNNLLWHEVSSFYGRGPTERIYITRQDDKGKTTVMFGDGKNGARLPTGQENVRAIYRKGIGDKGFIKS